MASPNSAFHILLILIFAGITTNFTVGSHNLHNYKRSSSFHKSCLQNYGGVWFGQELWLQEKQLSQMTDLGVQFVARSGMEEAVGSGMLKGRPFGGVSIAWAPEMNHVMKPLVNYRHKRLVCVEMATKSDSKEIGSCIHYHNKANLYYIHPASEDHIQRGATT